MKKLLIFIVLGIFLVSCTIVSDENKKNWPSEQEDTQEPHNCFVVPNQDYWCNSPVNPSRNLYPPNPLSVWGNGGFDE